MCSSDLSLVDFDSEVKLTGSARAKNRKKNYFENKVHFYRMILVNTKTTIPLRGGA